MPFENALTVSLLGLHIGDERFVILGAVGVPDQLAARLERRLLETSQLSSQYLDLKI